MNFFKGIDLSFVPFDADNDLSTKENQLAVGGKVGVGLTFKFFLKFEWEKVLTSVPAATACVFIPGCKVKDQLPELATGLEFDTSAQASAGIEGAASLPFDTGEKSLLEKPILIATIPVLPILFFDAVLDFTGQVDGSASSLDTGLIVVSNPVGRLVPSQPTSVIRLNQSGIVQSAKIYAVHPEGKAGRVGARRALEMPDGSLYILTDANDDTDNYNVVLLKLDPDGKAVWAKTIDVGKDDMPTILEKMSDGGVVLAGYDWGGLPKASFILRFAANGSVIWKKQAFGFGSGNDSNLELSISRLHSYILPKAAEFQNFASDTLSILA